MNYNIILVDDEKIICDKLRSLSVWKDNGYNVAGCFYSAEEALAFMRKSTIHVVMTDITMPDMDGIEFAEIVKREFPQTVIVFFSGYQDFEYARRAMSLGIRHYLTKPIFLDDIQELITKLGEELSKCIFLNSSGNDFNSESKDFLFNVGMNNYNNKEALMEKAKNLNIEQYIKGYCFSFFQIDFIDMEDYLKTSWTHDKSSFGNAVINIMNFQNSSVKYYCIENQRGEMSVLGCHCRKSDISSDISAASSEIRNMLNIDFVINLLCTFEDIADFKKLYKTYIFPKDKLYAEQKQLQIFLLEQDYETAVSVVNKIADILTTLKPKEAGNFINILANDFLNITGEASGICGNKTNSEDFRQLFTQKLHELHTKQMENTNLSVQKALDYIEENYKEGITLTSISRLLYVNPSYFCRLFKKTTGKNFTDYLLEVRIKRACDMLKNTDRKIYEIASSTGYKSLTYFHKIFRSVTGQTPQAYRDTHRNNSNAD